MVAVSWIVVNHDGRGGTALGAMIWVMAASSSAVMGSRTARGVA